MRRIIVAGETFSWEQDIEEEAARARWYHNRPGRTFVAVDHHGTIVGTAESEPNHGGPGAHVATASFMVDPDHQGHGVGRALCTRVLDAARADGYLAMQFNAVVETNAAPVALWRSFGFEILAHGARGVPPPDRRVRWSAHHVPPSVSAQDLPFSDAIGLGAT